VFQHDTLKQVVKYIIIIIIVVVIIIIIIIIIFLQGLGQRPVPVQKFNF
jgi:preprotein translocase subunit SecY